MMEFVVIRHTSDYRGDHTADVFQVHKVKDGETVADLAKRLLENRSPDDSIVIRRVIEEDELVV